MKPFVAMALLTALLLVTGCSAEEKGALAGQNTPALDVAPAAVFTPAPTAPSTPTPEPTPPPRYVIDGLFTVVCADTVNMRKEASSRAELVTEVSNGTEVKVLSYDERYAEVELTSTGQKGYVIAGYLKPADEVFALSAVKLPFAGAEDVPFNYTYEQMKADMDALAAAYPEAVKLTSAGKSVEGKELYVLVLGDKDAKHQVFIQAAIHAREHMTTPLVMALAEQWLIEALPYADVCFHIMPMANPDGVSLNQELKFNKKIEKIYQSDGASGRSSLTGAPYLAEWKANANGVDLNRNFDAMWENVLSTDSASYSDYRGSKIESEPETKALVSYTKKHNFAATLSYHATGSMIYSEFGPNSPVNEASKRLARAVSAVSGYKLEGDDGTSFGGYKDWASYKLNIPSITMEIGTRKAPLPENEFYTIWLRNRHVLEAVAEWVEKSTP